MREIAGGDDVRQTGTYCAAHFTAFGEVQFDEAAMTGRNAAEGVQSFHDAGSVRPTRADAAGKCEHGNLAARERIMAGGLVLGRAAIGRVEDVVGRHIFNSGGNRQTILRQAETSGAHILLNRFMLDGIEAVLFEKRAKIMARRFLFLLPLRKKMFEQFVDNACELGHSAAGGAEVVELDAARGRKLANIAAQQGRNGEHIVIGGSIASCPVCRTAVVPWSLIEKS